MARPAPSDCHYEILLKCSFWKTIRYLCNTVLPFTTKYCMNTHWKTKGKTVTKEKSFHSKEQNLMKSKNDCNSRELTNFLINYSILSPQHQAYSQPADLMWHPKCRPTCSLISWSLLLCSRMSWRSCSALSSSCVTSIRACSKLRFRLWNQDKLVFSQLTLCWEYSAENKSTWYQNPEINS